MRSKGRSSSCPTKKVSLPVVVLMCIAFFCAGYFTFLLVPGIQGFQGQGSSSSLQRQKLVEVVADEQVSEHGETGDDVTQKIPFQVLSWKPRAVLYRKFASKEQCEKIVEIARKRLTPSGLALRKGETAANTNDIRTSSGTFLSSKHDKTGVLALIEEKMARATMIPRHHGEAFNVLRYEIGQKYNSHYDFFDPAEYGPQKSQRMASFLLYLSDVEEGGETMFPFENFQNMHNNYDYKQCTGLRVKPSQGDALLFFSMLPNGTFDKSSLHGSCPVVKGEKWVATKWIRDTAEERLS